MPLPTLGCTTVLVSWDGDGLFTGPYDDVTADVLGTPGVTIDGGRDGARQLSPPKVSAADFMLRNDDGKYSQEHGGSPVYQRVVPGRPCRVQVAAGETDAYDTAAPYDAADYYDGVAALALARTVIDDISQETVLGQQTVTLRTLGVETLLIGTTVTVGVMTAPRVDQCISAILDAVGWPAAQRAVSISDTTLLYWWCDDRAPWPALMELLASEGPGSIYVTPSNTDVGAVFHFENRNYRTTAARSTTAQASFFDRRGSGAAAYYDQAAAYDAPDAYDGEADVRYFTALSYDPGFRNIWNAARYPTKRRTLGALAPIWTYGTTLQPPASPGVTLVISPASPFQNAVVPVAGTDYTVSGGTVAMSLSATSGLVAFLTVVATSGAPVVSALQLRAQPLTVTAETTVTNLVDASASIAKFSPIPGASIPRVLDVAGWPEVDPAVAMAVCDAWVTRYMVQRPAVTIEVRNVDGPHLAEILRRTVSDRISLRERNSGLAADVWINSKAVTIAAAGGRDIRCQFGCEKVDEARGAIWDGPDVPANRWDTAIWGI
jgi:hypothetical protein